MRVEKESKEEYLLRLPFWQYLTEEEKVLLRERTVMEHHAKGSVVHSFTTECLGPSLVLEGELRTYILSEEGREVTLFHLYEGDTSILTASCIIHQITFDTQTVAEKDSDLLVIPSSVYSQLTTENIYVRCFTYELTTARFSAVMWTMQQILFKGFDSRLAAFLVGEYERTGSLSVKLTHEQIAQRISSAREVVARMLKRFVVEGLVTVKRGDIRILDLAALRLMV